MKDKTAPRLHDRPQPTTLAPRALLRGRRPLATVLLLGAVLLLAFWRWRPAVMMAPLADLPHPWPVHGPRPLVPLEAHIISKCPDTRDALRQLIIPTMQQVHDKVDFRLSYIGFPTANDGIECLHGPSECLGNIIELCAAALYPEPKIYLGFVMCLTNDYESIPQRGLVEDCALEHAVDFHALNECAARDDGEYGLELLRNSTRRSAEAGATTSCTIRLNNDVYCIRDQQEWKDCPRGPGVNDLVVAIEQLYRSS